MNRSVFNHMSLYLLTNILWIFLIKPDSTKYTSTSYPASINPEGNSVLPKRHRVVVKFRKSVAIRTF